jgi:hypothetical protein
MRTSIARQLLKKLPAYVTIRKVYLSIKRRYTFKEQWARVVMNRETQNQKRKLIL